MLNSVTQLWQNRRALNFTGFAACTGMMAFALYAQHGLHLEPCPLCVFQRVAVIAMGSIFLLAVIHNPGRVGGIIYGVLVAIVSLGGAGVAARHFWLQNLPPEKVPACGPGLDFMLEAFPLTEMLQLVLSGSGECAEISWSLLGLSMPAWVFIALSFLGVFGVVVNVFNLPAQASSGQG